MRKVRPTRYLFINSNKVFFFMVNGFYGYSDVPGLVSASCHEGKSFRPEVFKVSEPITIIIIIIHSVLK